MKGYHVQQIQTNCNPSLFRERLTAPTMMDEVKNLGRRSIAIQDLIGYRSDLTYQRKSSAIASGCLPKEDTVNHTLLLSTQVLA